VIFNVIASLLAWFMASAMTSAVALAFSPAEQGTAVMFSTDWRSVLGWVCGALFAIFVYRTLARKDRAMARRQASASARGEDG
jgi:hypothetical protein